MITIIKTLNLNRETTAILENAYGIGYQKQSNAIWQASFSLPINDPKVKKVELLKYVEITDKDEYIGLFRIIPKQTSSTNHSVTFQCEHVLATLLGSTLFKYHQLTNYSTKEVLQYLLDQQKVKHIVLGTVAFTRYFHYSWENENLLSAIFSVPKPFNEQSRWYLDTTTYPWVLSLLEVETEPTCRLKEGYNLIGFEIEEDPRSVFNRIYPLGAGEGVNQLTIESVNNGVPYIEDIAPGEEIMETPWSDKRFEDAATLKATAEALLQKWKKPIITWKASAADVSSFTGLEIDKLKEGRVLRIELDDYPTTELRIMKESKSDITGDPGNVQLEIGNLQEDLGTTQADLERRQQINELYSQGATNIDSYTFNDNCDTKFPAVVEFPFPADMVNVNESTLRIKTSPYRVPMVGMEDGGQFIQESVVQSESTEDGGAYVKESTVQSKSTEDGGAYSQPSTIVTDTTPSGGKHYHKLFQHGGDAGTSFPSRTYYSFAKEQGYSPTLNLQSSATGNLYTFEADGDHVHQVSLKIPGINIAPHTHGFFVTIPAINIPKHNHRFKVTIPAINIKPHTHKQIYGIHEQPLNTTQLTVKIDGVKIPFDGIEGEIDITDYLRKDSNGKVTRDYHKIEVLPNDLARINLILSNRFFVRSHIGGTF